MKKLMTPRNHVVLAAIKRSGGAGSHGKSTKASRRANKIALRKGVEWS